MLFRQTQEIRIRRLTFRPLPASALIRAGTRRSAALRIRNRVHTSPSPDEVPPTRYFQVIGRADYDNWLYLQLMNADMIINRPNYYAGGEHTGDKAALSAPASSTGNSRDKTG